MILTAACPNQSPVQHGWPFVFTDLSPMAVLARDLLSMQAAGSAGNKSLFTNILSLMAFHRYANSPPPKKKKKGFSDILGV